MYLNKKIKMVILAIMTMMPLLTFGSVMAADGGGWIGRGSSGSTPVGGGEDCSTNEWFQDECSGWSWAFYKTLRETDDDIPFPQLGSDSGATITDAEIPAECSKHGENGGFYHKGVNLINGCISGGQLSQGNGNCNGDAWTGHWYTIGKTPEWIPYHGKTVMEPYLGWSKKQTISKGGKGIYELEGFHSPSRVLKAYNQALVAMGEKEVTVVPDNVWGFCWWEGGYTLTVKAIDTDGNSLERLMSDKTDTAESGKSASVTVEKSLASGKYTFEYFKEEDGDLVNGTRTYSVDKMTKNVTVYAVYRTLQVTTIPLCDKEGKRSQAGDKVKEYYGVGENVTLSQPSVWDSVDNRGFLGWAESPTSSSLITGEKYVIEKIGEPKVVYAVFQCGGDVVSKSACDGLIDVPDSYNGSTEWEGTTSTGSGVINNNTKAQAATNQSVGDPSVYAKPNDEVSWCHAYFPGVQRLALKDVTASRSGHKSQEEQNSCDETEANCERPDSYRLNNEQLYSVVGWSNKYDVTGSKRSGALEPHSPSNWNGQPGDDAVGEYRDDYKVKKVDDVGNVLTETITTGAPVWAKRWVVNDDWRCKWKEVEEGKYDWSDTCSHDGTYISYDVNTSNTSTHANVIVPYNFRNSTSVKADKNDHYFAGETSPTLNSEIKVGKRQNDTTQGEYATIVRDAYVKYRICIEAEGSCIETAEQSLGALNSSGNMGGVTEQGKGLTFTVPDVAAGTVLSIYSMVYPINSGDERNINVDPFNNSGSRSNPDNWAVSAPYKVRVAKRPMLQVLGGNVYSGGAINTGLAQKMCLNGWSDCGKNRVFGSYGELGVISWGTVKGFASGASLGYATNNDSVLVPAASEAGLDNREVGDLCRLSPLTFANSCEGDGVSGKKGQLADGVTKDFEVVSALGDLASEGHLIVNDGVSELTANPAVENGDVVVYKSGGDLAIKTDINMDWGGAEYGSFREIARVVVIAKGDIRIDCGVGRIDSVLVAGGKVVTCYTDGGDGDAESPYDDDINTAAHSNPLIVNGAIIAKKLVANRTYGAATGENSIVPAEVINFDPTLYAWGGSEKETGGGDDRILNGDLTTTYIRELSPRL